MARQLPTYGDVVAARRRIGSLACRTPLIEHPALNAVQDAIEACSHESPPSSLLLKTRKQLIVDRLICRSVEAAGRRVPARSWARAHKEYVSRHPGPMTERPRLLPVRLSN